MRRYLKILLIVGVVVLIIAGGIATRAMRSDRDVPRSTTASRRNVVQEITFTGQLESKTRAESSFEVGGTVTQLPAVGDTVEEGQTLARLDTTGAQLEVTKANADQAAAEEEARLAWQDKEETAQNVQEENSRTLEKLRQNVRNAKAELDQYRDNFQQTARDDGDNASTTLTARATLEGAESKWSAAQRTLDEAIKTTKKTNAAAEAAADLTEAQYISTTQTAPQVAGLSSLEASEALARHKVSQGYLTAPFSGVVTEVKPKVGEYVAAGSTVITVETPEELELVANVPETDATKIAENLPATVTFDALPLTEQWEATVTHRSPAAKVIEGVPTYEIRLSLDKNTERLLPGLTANITVHADRRDNVIAVPRRAVIVRGTEEFVRILEGDGEITEQAVTTGLAGSDGAIEITSGLSEGQHVVTTTVTDK